jgi:hypothetical protein
MQLMQVLVLALLMVSAMAGDAMDCGLWVALLVSGLLFWFGQLLGGAGSGEELLFEW